MPNIRTLAEQDPTLIREVRAILRTAQGSGKIDAIARLQGRVPGVPLAEWKALVDTIAAEETANPARDDASLTDDVRMFLDHRDVLGALRWVCDHRPGMHRVDALQFVAQVARKYVDLRTMVDEYDFVIERLRDLPFRRRVDQRMRQELSDEYDPQPVLPGGFAKRLLQLPTAELLLYFDGELRMVGKRE